MFDEELSKFKTDIDLRAYAAEQGYHLDRKESSRGSSVMRHPNGDKVLIKRGSDGHYVYFSVRQEGDNGTIIDFVQHRHSKNGTAALYRQNVVAPSRSSPARANSEGPDESRSHILKNAGSPASSLS